MSFSSESLAQKRTLSSLLAGRVVKRPKQEDGQRLHEAAIQLLEQNQNICSLFKELGQNPDQCNTFWCQNEEQKQAAFKETSVAASLLGCELRRQAAQLGVPVTALSVKTMLARLNEITEETDEKQEEEDGRREMLTSSQTAQLCALLQSSRELLTQGVLCPKLLWQELRRDQKLPRLEVVYYLHFYNILTLKYIVESDEGVRSWLVPQLKLMCGWKPPQGEVETKHVQQEVLSTVIGVLVKTGFDQSRDAAAADRKLSVLCCSMLDEMLIWLLEAADKCLPVQSCEGGAQLWIQTFDSSLYGVSVSPEALQSFFTHSLTQTLTYNPQLTVSDAITLQNKWIFARSSRLLTSLFQKLAVVFSAE
ncbi:Fanconi anemia group A protein, partial [Austrofundulus limnaeus]|uniref:Fanconi anemia group A protein n=1 Tax=Austrofundulus limnaeus TaxID=52670 RepID=A0A2I4DAH3_AUSLI